MCSPCNTSGPFALLKKRQRDGVTVSLLARMGAFEIAVALLTQIRPAMEGVFNAVSPGGVCSVVIQTAECPCVSLLIYSLGYGRMAISSIRISSITFLTPFSIRRAFSVSREVSEGGDSWRSLFIAGNVATVFSQGVCFVRSVEPLSTAAIKPLRASQRASHQR